MGDRYMLALKLNDLISNFFHRKTNHLIDRMTRSLLINYLFWKMDILVKFYHFEAHKLIKL